MLDHFAQPGGKTSVAVLFTDAKYSSNHPAVASRLASHMVRSVGDCAPRRSALRHVEQVIAVPSSKGLSHRLAVGLAEFLQLPRPDRNDLRWNRRLSSVKNVPVANRGQHVAGAMSAAPITANSVLLVDDAVQSQATLLEAARAVRQAGADRVIAIALVAVD